MKKATRKKLSLLFWLVFALGCAWLIWAPAARHGPPSVAVKVQPPEIAEPVHSPPPVTAGGEEQTQAPAAGETVTVPVVPEKEEAVPLNGAHPKIAIVIDDVGVDLKGSEKAIHLPAPVTLSFLPYAIRLREQARDARDNGHELLLHMPMEPIGREDPGPGALLTNLPMDELRQRFEAALSSFPGFDGVNNHMGSKFTAWPEGMDMVMDELQQRDLFFFDSRTSANSVGMKIAVEKKLPTVSRDVFLDDDQSPDAIRAQLANTERVARRKGYAVAIGHPHATTMEVLEVWTIEAKKRGFDLVPLKALVK